MPSALPEGEPAPPSGELPPHALRALGSGPFGVYVHVPFCTVRCGYCDFNTYTLTELGVPGASVGTYADVALGELELAARVLGPTAPAVSTVFFGGGTPTVLPAADLVRMLDGIRTRFGLADGAEVTTEANPDSVTPASLQTLAAGGFNRVSMGMQSAVPHVLATLERTHDPVNVARAVAGAKAAGLKVSVDLIYGTPGESPADWRTSLAAAVDLGPDHISAYALVVEEGTKLGALVRRGDLPAPQDDDEAEKYEVAEQVLGQAGFGWYEVSNWARTKEDRCRHNEGYWTDGHWWGVGPGAHSHVGGVRWWNVKHPNAFAARLGAGLSPAAGREVLTAEQRYDERVLLGIRLVDGLPIDDLRPVGVTAVAGLIADGLVDGPNALGRNVQGVNVQGVNAQGSDAQGSDAQGSDAQGSNAQGSDALRPRRVVLTLRGRLLADTVVRRLLGF